MKKQILASALLVAVSMTANAGSLEGKFSDSIQGSIKSGKALVGLGVDSVEVSIDGAVEIKGSASVIKESAKSAVSLAKDEAKELAYSIWTTDLATSVDLAVESGRVIFTTSGNILFSVGNKIVHPIATSGQAWDFSTDAALKIVRAADGSVQVVSAYSQDKFGENAQLLVDGSGEILTASKDVVVISGDAVGNAASATYKFSKKKVGSAADYVSDKAGQAYNYTADKAGKAYKGSKNIASKVVTFVDETSVETLEVSADLVADLVSNATTTTSQESVQKSTAAAKKSVKASKTGRL